MILIMVITIKIKIMKNNSIIEFKQIISVKTLRKKLYSNYEEMGWSNMQHKNHIY